MHIRKKQVPEFEGELEISVYDSVYQVDLEEWHTAANGDIYASRPYLQGLENSLDDNLVPKYIVAKLNNQVVGAGMFTLVNFSGQELTSYIPEVKSRGILYRLNYRLQKFLNCAILNKEWKLLVSGNIFSTGSRHFYTTNVSDRQSTILLELAMKTVQDTIRDKVKISGFLQLEYYKDNPSQIKHVKDFGYSMFEIEQDLVMPLDNNWSEFKDYMQALSSKYRVRTRKAYSRSRDLEKRELSLTEIIRYEKQIYRLYQNVADRAGFAMGHASPTYFSKMKAELGDKFHVVGYFDDNELVSFISSIENGKCLLVHFVGLNYELLVDKALYQRILYDSIDQGINMNADMIQFGRTAPEIKSTVGARPRAMVSFLRHTNWISNWLIKPFFLYFKPKPWEIRHPFKDGDHNEAIQLNH